MANFLTRLISGNRRERALRKHAIDDTLWHNTLERLPFLVISTTPIAAGCANGQRFYR